MSRPPFRYVVLLFLVGLPVAAHAGCPSTEVVATVLFSGDLTLGQLEAHLVSAVPVGPETNPTDDEIRTTLSGVYPSSPLSWSVLGSAPPFRLWWISPVDFGAEAIVDDRTGQVAFAGSIVWAGLGGVILPDASTHVISELAGPPADAATVFTLPSPMWDEGPPEWPTTAELTALAAEWLRHTDLGHAFAGCAPPWDVIGHVYTPAVGLLDPALAQLVVLVRGRPGPPWGPVGLERTSWAETKAGWR